MDDVMELDMRNKISTPLSDLLGIRYPIIQGGMAWVSTARLVAAVSEAGGLGIIGAGQMDIERLEKEIKETKELTDKPFGVNIMLLNPESEKLLAIVLRERVPVVTTGAGNPGPHIAKLKEVGIKVIPVCASIALAQRVEKQGADAIIVEGMEAGGHIGELTTFSLVPQVVDAVNIPVIAAGGIADGRGFAAALMLGASGVQIGTRFICSTECTIHDNYKNRVIAARDRDTVVTGRSTGHPVRIIKNKLSREFDRREKNGELEGLGELGVGRLKLAAVDGDMEWGSVMAGQIAGLVNDVKPVSQIIEDIIKDALDAIERSSKILS